MSLKILHVGNIAQNAYINALILNARGHDCDVIAPDFYHVASSPEWYELGLADIDSAALGDDLYFPDFYALGRNRPLVGDWVAHGPMLASMQYLTLKRRGDPLSHLALSTLNYLRFKATVRRTTAPFASSMSDEQFATEVSHYDLSPKLRRRIETGRMADRYFDWIRSRLVLQMPPEAVRDLYPPLSIGYLDNFFAADPVLEGGMRGLRERGLAQALNIEFVGPLMEHGHLEGRGIELSDVIPYCWTGLALRELTALYDLCIFYGETSKYAFAAGIEGYWALEHGTIRSLPFQPTSEGRLTAASYLNAKRVLLTNTDYATAQQKLKFSEEQLVYFLHPFDEAPAIAARRRHVRRPDPDSVVFLCPARQDWQSGDPISAKGNDLYFRAGRLLLDRGRTNFVFRCVDWGVDREASRTLVAELGLADHVRWVPMLSKRGLWTAKLDAHAVIDQFVVSALGGVSFETLALGCRLISRDDGFNNAAFFEEPPPILAAATVEEIVSWMEFVMDDPDDLVGWGERGADWVVRHHSADRLHDLQMAAFRGRRDRTSVKLTAPAPLERRSADEVMRCLAQRYPSVFPLWKRLFDNALKEYVSAPQVNLSVDGHAGAKKYGWYLQQFARGTLLDIGCGPQPLPIYLSGYPKQLIAGCDPLPAPTEHPFEFCCAVGEDLPWPDASFETVSIGTSLDHAIDLSDMLDEIFRVMAPGGRLITWVGFISGGKPYLQTAQARAADSYHLFHFDQDWFEAIMRDRFVRRHSMKVGANEWFYFYEKECAPCETALSDI